MVMLDQVVYTTEEARVILKISMGTLRALLHDGTIASIRTGRNYRITAKALQAYLDGE